MALVKKSTEIISVRGRFGGVYFKGGPDGTHIQAMPRVWNYVRSPAQIGTFGEGSGFLMSGIRGYSGAAAIWLAALVAVFSVAWAVYAMAYVFYRAGKEPKKITGYNWFIHYALAFPECERFPFWKPPHSPNDLPSFIVVYQGRWTYEHPPDEWPADCCSDYYWPGLFWNGKPSYRNDRLTWFLWWKDGRWIISEGLDFEDPNTTFYSSGADIIDYYRNPVTGKWTHVYFGNPDEVLLPH